MAAQVLLSSRYCNSSSVNFALDRTIEFHPGTQYR